MIQGLPDDFDPSQFGGDFNPDDLPEDFDPKKELEEARAERYGRIDRYECCD